MLENVLKAGRRRQAAGQRGSKDWLHDQGFEVLEQKAEEPVKQAPDKDE